MVVPHYLPAESFGGVLQSAHALGRELLRHDCRVRVVTTNMKTHVDNLDVPDNRSQAIDNVEVYYSPVVRQHHLRRWGFAPAMPGLLWRQVGWADVVILHFHYQFATWAGALISRLRQRPYIISVHGSLNKYALAARSTTRKLRYLRYIEGGNFGNAAAVAYQSEEEREYSLTFGPSIIIPNGIDPADFDGRPPAGALRTLYPELAGRFVFLYLGRLDPNKGLDLLLPAFASLQRERPNTHLLLAGPNERGYQAQLERLVAGSKMEAAVTFTGYIDGDRRLAALQDADAFVLPSRYEGLSMSMLEALYNGRPVITTNRVGLWRRLQDEACAHVIELDEGQLLAAMQSVVDDIPAARAMGERGRRLVNNHLLWSRIAGDLRPTLAALAGNRKTGGLRPSINQGNSV